MKRFLIALVLVLVVLCGLSIAVFFGIGYYLSPQDALSKTDAIVAISGGETEARTAEAIKLYQDGWAKHLIFSGAALDPNSPSNASTMAKAAIKAGVPETDISLDETSANTRQNAANVSEIIQQADMHSIILVTSPYHQRRANIAFHRAMGPDVAIINHSSFDGQWRRSHWWATPTSQALTFSELQKVAYELASGQAQ